VYRRLARGVRTLLLAKHRGAHRTPDFVHWPPELNRQCTPDGGL